MKRFLLFISIVFLTFLSAGFIVPERLTIVELNTETLTVGNRELKVGGCFSSDQTIYWKSPKQAAEVQDNTGQLYIFTKEAFEQKNVKTPKEYLMSGKFSTRPAYDSPKTGRNKSFFPEKRVAMVIGNSNYVSKADFLRAPIADAGMISEKLVDLGFDTYTICDASSSDLFRAVDKFSEVASRYDIALFYYAGHGFCYNHENYYQPVDISDIDYESVHRCLNASELMSKLTNISSIGTIVVLDACRNVAKVRGGEELAFIEAPSGMMVLCSTTSGDRAVDAIGKYSPFAKAFANNISIKGLPISETTRKIRNDVRAATSQIQIPSCSDNLYSNFIFLPKEEPIITDSTLPVVPQKDTPTRENSVQFFYTFIDHDLDLQHDVSIDASGADYGFKYGTYTGSTIGGHAGSITGIGSLNYHNANSYAWAKLTFTLPVSGQLIIQCANDGEDTYDFGLISQIDQELIKSVEKDTSSTILKRTFSGQQMLDNVYYDNVSAGRHFVTVKYRKDASSDMNLDRFVITGIKHIFPESNMIVNNIEKENTMTMVDLGLSVKWATCNLGATKPEEYGKYYQWAGTNDISDTSINADLDNCPYHTGPDHHTGWTKYIPSDDSSFWSGTGHPDNKTVLEPNDDAAYVNWGAQWRMPTDAEWKELVENCKWTWTEQKGVKGYKVTSKKFGYTDKSIFLPAAGLYINDYIDLANSYGYYWSSSLDLGSPHRAYNLNFNSDHVRTVNFARPYGQSVRPVSD